jgi:radical SAM superfamily enzyme YgiQ (UPF0313 family)
MKVLGIYPQGEYIPTGGNREWTEPLGLEYILGQAASIGHEVDFLTMYQLGESELVHAAIEMKPEVIAMSAMTCQTPRVLRIASKIKRDLPAVRIILGGYQPSAIRDMPEVATDAAIDYWVVGEGEKTFSEILQSIQNGQDPHTMKIPGLARLENGKIELAPRQREQNLDVFSSPWRPMGLVKQLKNFGLTYPAPREQTGCATLDFSRGCLGSCDFCSSPGVLGCSVSFHSSEYICHEIKRLYLEHDINGIYFCDLDFVQQGENQKFTEELCHKLIALNLPVYWEAMCRIQSIINTQNYPLIELMYEAGCRKICWGIESLNPEVAKSMGKGHLGVNDPEVEKVLHTSQEAGILNTGLMVIGWHDFNTGIGDTKKSIMADLGALLEYSIHRIRVAIGTPLPGSQFYRECKKYGMLTTDDLEYYDTTHLVYRHPTLNGETLYQLRTIMCKTFYQSRQFNERIGRMIEHHPEYREVFEEFLQELQQSGQI